MAHIHTVRLVDDLDGKTADETIFFALDGQQFEIDLASGNAMQLREALAPFVAAGRRASGSLLSSRRRSNPGSTADTATRVRNQAVRSWARENGFTIGDRGRIPTEVALAYDDAQNSGVRPATTSVTFSG